MKAPVLHTPDGRYIVVRGRLWRASNPNLSPAAHDRLVADLMNARRAVKDAGDSDIEISQARKAVDAAKVGIGERGAVWWTDGSPDLNRHLVRNSPYAQWYKEINYDR